MSSFGRVASITKVDPEGDWTAARLVAELPPISAAATCAQVFERLNDAKAPVAAAVVDDEGRVLGLVNRLRFLARYAQRFIPELFDPKPIMTIANPAPFVVDEHISISDLAAMITLDHPDALYDSFIVTRNGRYMGIGTGDALVRAKVDLLNAREEQLNQALVAAEDADRTRSNFLALMSHELRTPLNAIIGFSEVLAGEMFGAHAVKKYGEYARDIRGAGRHLLALINDILDLAKSDAGHLTLYSEPVDVPVLLRDCIRLLEPRAADGRVTVTLDIEDELPAIRADTLRIKQIVLNLMSNAVKFTMAGGEVRVFAGLDDKGGMEIAIADTGIGMAPEEIPIALEPFRQIESPLSRNVEGTGLGLSLAKSLAERHGGMLKIESAPGKGTTARLILPPGRTIHFDAAEAKAG